MPRKKRRARSAIVGLSRRGDRAYYSRVLPEAVGGDRLYRALDAEWESDVAVERATALNLLYSRGDWDTLRHWHSGEIHISRVVKAVREGDWKSLRLLHRDGVLLGAAVEDFLRRVEATTRHRTFLGYQSLCNTLLAELEPTFDMSTLTTAAAEEFLHRPRIQNGAELEPWSASTQRNARFNAGAIWDFVIERQAEEAKLKKMLPALTENPWKKAKIREPRKKRPAVLSEREMAALLNHRDVKGTPAATMLAIGLLAGLRQAEILNLRRQDLFLEGPRPFIRVQSRAGSHEWETKTENSERDVPVPSGLVRIIAEHIDRGFAGVRYLITTSDRDQPINPSTSDDWTRKAFEAAGLKYGRKSADGLTIHHTRHSNATLLLSKGVSIAAVAERLGDTQETILSTYSHALPDDHERALQILESVL